MIHKLTAQLRLLLTLLETTFENSNLQEVLLPTLELWASGSLGNAAETPHQGSQLRFL